MCFGVFKKKMFGWRFTCSNLLRFGLLGRLQDPTRVVCYCATHLCVSLYPLGNIVFVFHLPGHCTTPIPMTHWLCMEPGVLELVLFAYVLILLPSTEVWIVDLCNNFTISKRVYDKNSF